MEWPGVCADTIKPIHDKSDFINVKLILKELWPRKLITTNESFKVLETESKNISELPPLVGWL